jgi:hypothetical protein
MDRDVEGESGYGGQIIALAPGEVRKMANKGGVRECDIEGCESSPEYDPIVSLWGSVDYQLRRRQLFLVLHRP